MSDDAAQTVYHATCALELATDILRGASLPRHHTGQLSAGDRGRGQPVEGTTAGDGLGMEALVESVCIEGAGSRLLRQGMAWFPPGGVLAPSPLAGQGESV